MIDLKLETFLTLCCTKNYTQTATVLNITQPAVSQHMKYLETYYNTKLFYYEGRNLQLTAHGELLRYFAQTIKSDSQIIKTRLLVDKSEPEEFKLGTITTTGEVLVPHMIAEYLKLYPHKKVSMYLGETDKLLNQLKEGLIQFAIVDGYIPREEYDSELLFVDETICVCSPRHPFAGKTVDFQDINSYRLVFRENDTNSQRNLIEILRSCNQDIHSFQSYVEMGTINAVKKMVMEDTGISFIYRFVVQNDLDEGSLCQIHLKNFSSHHYFSFVWMKNSFFALTSQGFLEVCQKTLQSIRDIPKVY